MIQEKIYCGECGAEIKRFGRKSQLKCEYCKKYLCENCIAHQEKYDELIIVFCKKCYEIHKSITAAYIECEDIIDRAERIYYEKKGMKL